MSRKIINACMLGNSPLRPILMYRRSISQYTTIKIAKLCQSCDSFCVHNLQETTFVCTIATDNFCFHYYNWKHFKHYSNCQLLYALLQLPTFFIEQKKLLYGLLQPLQSITSLHFLTFQCRMVINTLLCTITIDCFCLDCCNWGLLYAADQH